MFINVAIAVVTYENRYLLVRRRSGNFPNLWGLVGGKLEDGEHIDNAIARELKEETELEVTFDKLIGISTEMVTDKDKTMSTVLFCCSVNLINYQKQGNLDKSWFSENEKLELKWFTKEELLANPHIIGSDLLFLKHFYFDKDTNYMRIDCQRDNNGKYTWTVV